MSIEEEVASTSGRGAGELDEVPSLGDNLLDVCMAVARDADRLFSLTARVRLLTKLGQVDRDLRRIVREMALPELSRRQVPKAELDTHAARKLPTLEWLATKSDQRVYRLEQEVCCTLRHRPGQPWLTDTKPRRTNVTRIMETARIHWDVVPLQRELRARRYEVLTRSEAASELRLRRADLAPIGPGPRFRREDLLDAALALHGSAAEMDRKAARVREAADKRAATARANVEVRQARRAEVEAATGASPRDWTVMMATQGDVADAVREYELLPPAPLAAAAVAASPSVRTSAKERKLLAAAAQFAGVRDATLAMAKGRWDEILGRRREVEALPWPPSGSYAASLVPVAATIARDDYTWFNGDSDRDRVRALSARWQPVADAWRGAHASPVLDSAASVSAISSAGSCAAVGPATSDAIPFAYMMPPWMHGALKEIIEDGTSESRTRLVGHFRSVWDLCVPAVVAHNAGLRAGPRHQAFVTQAAFRAAMRSLPDGLTPDVTARFLLKDAKTFLLSQLRTTLAQRPGNCTVYAVVARAFRDEPDLTAFYEACRIGGVRTPPRTPSGVTP